MTKTRRCLVATGLALAFTATWAAPALQGKVTRVIDGQNLIMAAADGREWQVELTGVVTPLVCQPWGAEARDALKEWALNREVRAEPVGRPAGTRMTARLTLDGADLSRRMVEEGQAWSARVKWDRGPYVAQERMAKALLRGLHGVAGLQPPAQYKRSKAPCAT